MQIQRSSLPYKPLMPSAAILLLEELEETITEDTKIGDLTPEDYNAVLNANESLIFWTALLTLYFAK